MSPVYYVAPGQETDGEPLWGYYFPAPEGDRMFGPYSTRDDAYDAYHRFLDDDPIWTLPCE